MTSYKFKDTTLKFLELNHFKELTKVQRLCLNKIIKGQNVMAIAPTGTGKTHAYLLPIMEMIDPLDHNLQVMISCPSKELALQIYDKAKLMSKVLTDLSVKLITSGQDFERMNLEGVQIVIGTPGKIKDLFLSGRLRVDKIRMFVVDEADMTLEFGFLNDIDAVLSKMKDDVQILGFSATLNKNLEPFIKKYLGNTQIIEVKDETKFAPKIDHYLVNCKHLSYSQMLLKILPSLNPYVCMIFGNTREECQEVARTLRENDYRILEIHGGLNARSRAQALRFLKHKDYTYIVCSDVAARGIDIDGVSHVISLGFPYDLEYYIHRSGRTGRSGRQGLCIALYHEEDDQSIKALRERGINFLNKTFKNGEFKDDTKRSNYLKRQAAEEKALAKALTRKKEKVKPGYKKKKNEMIKAIQKKRRREFIRQKIKEERKERYRQKAREKM